ncbi:CIR protein PIR protein [Plasmodium vinckei brucechwatti]|uniref:CIR protein PIR protein n=1 Tax=Plasmodium vinckei brucechwatti TaxID=119398 RepID=A0A6V7RS48_PLAVN|nr:CIR protein PIR protein [Plasmodium vinckei brucechwatti]
MAQPSYSIEKVYKDINTINGYFTETKQNGISIQSTNPIIDTYCHYGKNQGKGKCHDYYQRASSGVIYLLKNLKKYGLEDDKLAEYAILWLRYKLNRTAPYHNIKLNEFYNKYIETNKDYNEKIKDNDSDSMTHKEIIDTKKNLMDIKEMTNFSYPFSILIYLYNATNANNLDCKKYSNSASEFANRFKELNNDPNNIEGSSYNKILSTISKDYDNLKKKCDKFPSLPKIEPKNGIAQNPVASPVVNPAQIHVEKSGQSSRQIFGETPEVISSSSSILSTLIPGLSVVSVIPVFLGIAYKYSLFGVDKLFQRQYLRTKLKKVKKQMKLNI